MSVRPFRFCCLMFVLAGCHDVQIQHGNGNGGGVAGTGGGGSVDMTVPAPPVEVSCPNGGSTTLTGTVFAPNGTLPLYNAVVYVPTAPVAPLPSGASCDRCNGQVSGVPVAQTTTGPDGSFVLKDVPAGGAVPLVIQIGKWRRQVSVDVPACMSTPVPATLTRLPRNHTEGDMPQMAIATGLADPFECLLLKLGIDAKEITAPGGGGRVSFYTATDGPGTNLSPPAPKADSLFADLATLMKYDVVLLPCEGTPHDKPQPARDLLVQYLNAGGRVFTTHFSYAWLTYANSPFSVVGDWATNQLPPFGTYAGTIDTSFPKGQAFSQWLNAVTSPPVNGSFPIEEPRIDLNSVDPQHAQRWIFHAGDNKVQHMTFNTPLDAAPDDMGQPQYCGRVVFSDFHVTTAATNPLKASTFPDICVAGAMTTQEKALAFMLFDLSSCVQSDSVPPIS